MTIQQIEVRKVVRPDPEIEIEIKSNRPHVGKTVISELIRRALEKRRTFRSSKVSGWRPRTTA